MTIEALRNRGSRRKGFISECNDNKRARLVIWAASLYMVFHQNGHSGWSEAGISMELVNINILCVRGCYKNNKKVLSGSRHREVQLPRFPPHQHYVFTRGKSKDRCRGTGWITLRSWRRWYLAGSLQAYRHSIHPAGSCWSAVSYTHLTLPTILLL